MKIDPNSIILKVCAKYKEGPDTGIFTDGGSIPNPGRGSWAFIHVESGNVIKFGFGYDPETTNNRMELTALINAYKYLNSETNSVNNLNIFSDSNLCVQTVNIWAENWEKNKWKRKNGEISNLELVQELYFESKKYPNVKLNWIKAHNGWRWNEVVDSFAEAVMLNQL